MVQTRNGSTKHHVNKGNGKPHNQSPGFSLRNPLAPLSSWKVLSYVRLCVRFHNNNFWFSKDPTG